MFPGEATLPASSCSVTSSIPFHCRTGPFVGVFPMDFTKKRSLSGSCEELLCCPLWQAEPRSLAGAALSSHSLSSQVAPSCVIPCASSPESVAQTTCLPVWLCALGVRGPSTKPDHRRLLAGPQFRRVRVEGTCVFTSFSQSSDGVRFPPRASWDPNAGHRVKPPGSLVSCVPFSWEQYLG